MIYKIMELSSTTNGTDYWCFVKVDQTSTTDFAATTTDDVETKLKELLNTVPITKLKVITEIAFSDDIIFA